MAKLLKVLTVNLTINENSICFYVVVERLLFYVVDFFTSLPISWQIENIKIDVGCYIYETKQSLIQLQTFDRYFVERMIDSYVISWECVTFFSLQSV